MANVIDNTGYDRSTMKTEPIRSRNSFSSSSGSSSSSSGTSSWFDRRRDDNDNDRSISGAIYGAPFYNRDSLLNKAPDKYIMQDYKVKETANPFLRDPLSKNVKYNTYQRRVKNPEYDKYVNKTNDKYTSFPYSLAASMFGRSYEPLQQNDFQNQAKKQSIFGGQQTGDVFGPSMQLSLARRALFG